MGKVQGNPVDGVDSWWMAASAAQFCHSSGSMASDFAAADQSAQQCWPAVSLYPYLRLCGRYYLKARFLVAPRTRIVSQSAQLIATRRKARTQGIPVCQGVGLEDSVLEFEAMDGGSNWLAASASGSAAFLAFVCERMSQGNWYSIFVKYSRSQGLVNFFKIRYVFKIISRNDNYCYVVFWSMFYCKSLYLNATYIRFFKRTWSKIDDRCVKYRKVKQP